MNLCSSFCTLQIWTYADSKAHLRVCLQVAGNTSRVGHRRAHVRPLFVVQLMLAPRGVGIHWRSCIMTYACLLGTNVRREVFPLMSVRNVSVSALAPSSGDANFNIGHASKKLDSEVLARARIAYDAMQRSMTFVSDPLSFRLTPLSHSVSGSQPKGRGKDKGFGKGKGYGKAKGSGKGKSKHHATQDPYM